MKIHYKACSSAVSFSNFLIMWRFHFVFACLYLFYYIINTWWSFSASQLIHTFHHELWDRGDIHGYSLSQWAGIERDRHCLSHSGKFLGTKKAAGIKFYINESLPMSTFLCQLSHKRPWWLYYNDKIPLNTERISPPRNLCIHYTINYSWKIDFAMSDASSVFSGKKSKGIPTDRDGGNHSLHIFVYDSEGLRKQTNHKKKKFASCRVNSAPGNVTAGSWNWQTETSPVS